MSHDFIEKLPTYLHNFEELKKIFASADLQFDIAEVDLKIAWGNQFLFDADERGVARYEAMYGISHLPSDALDERKFRIYSYINQDLPYTIVKLNDTLTKLCGEGNFAINLDNENYYIEIKLALNNKSNYSSVVEVLEKMIPCNLVSEVKIMYNTHEVLAGFTHAELSAYTHEELREEQIE